MAELSSNYIVRNCLLFAFKALRNTKRHIEDSLRSPYEDFFADLAKTLSPAKKLDYSIPNSEVEAFYLKRMTEKEFISNIEIRILSKILLSGPGTVNTSACSNFNGATSNVNNVLSQYPLLFSVVWDLLSKQNSATCGKLPKLSGKQLWEMFLKIDTESQLKVHVDDIVDLILRIFRENGHNEKEENIKEWFCDEESITFWGFFSILTEKFVKLLRINIVQKVHEEVVSEFLKAGRLEKKGHVVHNWKSRWFVLTASSLSYFESHDNQILKGSIIINGNALVQSMPEYKARPHRFRIVCGESKTATEISTPNAKELNDWIQIIRMAIKLHNMSGRNFLHKRRQAFASLQSMSNNKGLVHSHSVDQPDSAQQPHRSLNFSKSMPLESDKSHKPKKTSLPSPPTSPEHKTIRADEFEDSTDYNDPPPLPPQRFHPSDPYQASKGYEVPVPMEVFDKLAFVKQRSSKKSNAEKNDRRRHSSSEGFEVEHIQSAGGDYALISHSNRGNRHDVTSLLSAEVRAQLSPESTSQIDNWEDEEEKKDGRKGGYIQLDFHTENGVRRPKFSLEESRPKTIDPYNTKFQYSKVVFEKTNDKECAERLKQNKPPPSVPTRYEGHKMPNKMASDSQLLYSGPEFNPKLPLINADSRSSPDIQKSENQANKCEPPYVNVRHGRPTALPRRGIASPITDQSPPIPEK